MVKVNSMSIIFGIGGAFLGSALDGVEAVIGLALLGFIIGAFIK